MKAADRLALALLAALSCAAVLPGLLPQRVFASVHTSIRKPLDAGLTETDRTEMLEGANLEAGDQLFQVLPERIALHRALERRELPLWWPEAGGGVSLVGAPGAEHFEPRVLLLGGWLGPVAALGWLAALSMFSLAALTFLFLRLRGLTPLGAGTGALAFALSGTLTSNLFYACKVDALVLLPGALAAAELWIRGRRAIAFVLLGAVAADSALVSFPQVTAVAAYPAAILGGARLWRSSRSDRGGILVLGMAAVLGFAVAAFHLLPVAEAAGGSGRAFSRFGVGGFTFGPTHALSLLVPRVLGDPTSFLAATWNPLPELLPGLRDSLGRYAFTETTLYAGLAALPLAMAGACAGRARAAAPLVGLALTAAFACGTPLALLPGVALGDPARALGGVAFFLAWLAAEGLDALATSRGARRAAWVGAALLVVTAAGAFAQRRTTDPREVGTRALAARTARGAPSTPDAAEKMGERWSREAVSALDEAAIAALLSAAGVIVACMRPRLRAVAPLILAADLAAFALRVSPGCSARSFLPDTPLVQVLRREAREGRIARLAPGDAIEAADFELLQPSLASALGLRDVSAYVVLPDAARTSVVRALAPKSLLADTFLTALPRGALDGPLADLLGVRVVLSRAWEERPGLTPIAARPGCFAFLRSNALGRAWVVPRARSVANVAEAIAALAAPGFDPKSEILVEGPLPADAASGSGGGLVETEDLSNRDVLLRVSGSSGGYLFESGPSGDGWTATLDGRPVPLLRANGAFRAVAIPRGDHEVRFTYMPRSFVFGAALSATALVALALGALLLARRKAP